MQQYSQYFRVFWTFLRNALVREMTFRGNFLITIFTRAFWFLAQVTLFEIIYRNVQTINDWTRPQYFAFMATAMLINSVVESFFMPNCANFSELIRTGNLDFALLKPIDTQFLVSFEKMELAQLNQILLAGGLLTYALIQNAVPITAWQVVMYLLFIAAGVLFFYSLMIALASTSVWMGRNQGLYDFWFYITVFARYPRSIYQGSLGGEILSVAFTFVIPILLVVTVPARTIAKTLEPGWLAGVMIVSSIAMLLLSRLFFNTALKYYRSASS